MKQKRLVTIQDLSCFGKCSITVALPVISTLGSETVVLPTAVLSTHTGEFKNYTFHPLYDEFKKITHHWESLNMEFDAIYVGYIGNLDLISAVSDFIDKFAKKDTVVFIDPVMADNGKFYSGLDIDYAKALSELCKKADIITPNMTEAMILSGKNPSLYKEPCDIKELTRLLSNLCENVIITGVHTPKTISTVAYDKASDEIFSADKPLYDGVFYGAGDLFSSAFIGLYINGKSLFEATQISSDFVKDCIMKTMDERSKYWYGLKFEQSLPLLAKTQEKAVIS
ncbi:MAG: pyridoxamine kinase [Clostridia bacterium]|nr:pyridoxamine kinase [Clostridia bacterium]